MTSVTKDPPWLEYQRRRFMRPDAWRYVKPGTPGYDPPPGIGYQEPACIKKARERRALDEARAAEVQAEADARAFRNELAAIRFELLLIKTALHARRRWRAKAGFDPNQPRVPAGNSDGGQWTDANGNPAESRPFDAADPNSGERERLIRLAGEIPTNDIPEIPKERPPTERERNRIARQAARRLGRAVLVLQAADWLAEKAAEIQSFYDPPKPLEELQRSLSPRERG